MFGRGNWAVFGIKQSTEQSVMDGLDNFHDLSQEVAVKKAKADKIPTFGINPFAQPRLDESGTKAIRILRDDFRLSDHAIGFWLCTNDQKDVTHAGSKKEQIAYDEMGKPFKFLNKDEKKAVETTVTSTAVVERKQFPVLVNFTTERVYVAATAEEDVEIAQTVLQELGGETFSTVWQFGGYDWATKFLNIVNEKTKFVTEMAERAEELQRFRKDEIEKMDDKMMESIVSNYYALSELDTGHWCGLTTPARIRMYRPADPIGTAGASLTFSLLRLSDDSEVAASAIVIQSLDSKLTKSGEKQIRRDLLTLDLTDNINLLDAGAALLKGFDIPGFKKIVKSAAKAQTGPLEIAYYWSQWLVEMEGAVFTFVDEVTETLGLDKKKFGLLPFATEAAVKETVEVG
jgi:uncharacterized protein with GYD domain